MREKSFVGGAVILMISGLIARAFGFFFRIFLSNLIGAEGMGIFQLIAPAYTLVILTLTAGISVAVSKMTAEEYARRHFINLRRITSCSLGLAVAAGIVASLLIYLNLNFISDSILKDHRTYYSLLLLVPCIPVIAAASALKGYFYGIQQVVPTAVSQTLEQIVKICLVVLLVGRFAAMGLEYACAVAIAAMALGEISNLGLLALVYSWKGRKDKPSRTGIMRKRTILKEIARVAAPVSANRFVISVMSAVEYILIPVMLIAGGSDTKSSMEMYGRLTGMAMPLIFFPSLVTSSLATTLVPAISEAVSLRNFKAVNYRISKSIQVTFILGIVFTAIFLTYPEEIGGLVYTREKIGSLLYMLSFSCVFIYLVQTLTGVLNGLGRQGVLLRNTIIGSAVRIASVCFLIPVYGIKSYIWGLTAGFFITAAISLININRITGLLIDLRNWLLKPGIVGVVMILAGRYIYHFFDIFSIHSGIKIMLTLGVNILATLLLMVMAGVLSRDEVLKLAGFKNR